MTRWLVTVCYDTESGAFSLLAWFEERLALARLREPLRDAGLSGRMTLG